MVAPGVRFLICLSCVGLSIFIMLYMAILQSPYQPQHGLLFRRLQRPTVDRHRVPTMPGNMAHVKVSQLDTQKCQAAYNRSLSAAKLQIAGYNHTHVPDCRLPLCDLNNNHVPVNVLTCDAPADKRVTEKVTVIVKTTQRLTETMRLIRSLHQYYPGLKVVVVDDEANLTIGKDAVVEREKQRSWQKFVSESNGLVYYTKLPGDAAISKGRNTALRLVKSNYFLLLDDDFIASEKTNISKMVDILDRTDLTIVSGDLAEGGGRRVFSGIVRIHQRDQSNQSQVFEYLDMAYEEIPFFPSCYAVDYVLNLFLGKTEHILKFGGWDENLPVGEHRDILLGLRKGGYKLAYCTDVVFTHRPPGFKLYSHTLQTFNAISKHYYADKWNLPFEEFVSCNRPQYFNYKCK